MSLSKRQLAMRADAIGGSEIGVLAGLSRWSTPIAIYEGKVLGYRADATLAMDLGTEFEDPVAKIWAKRNARHLVQVDTLQNPRYPVAIATPDRAVFVAKPAGRSDRLLQVDELGDAEKLLEVKTTTWRLRHLWGAEGTDFVPDDYLAQAQWEMGVAGVHSLDFAVLFDRDELATYHLSFSPVMFAAMVQIAERFLVDHVRAKVPPPPDASERYAEFLARAYPGRIYAKKEAIDLLTASERMEEIVLRYAKLKAAETRIGRHIELCKNEIKAEIGALGGLVSPRFGTLTWKRTKDGETFDAEQAFAELSSLAGLVIQAMPEGEQRAQLSAEMKAIAARHVKAKPGFRRLHATWANDAKESLTAFALRLDQLEVGHLEKSAVGSDAEEASEEERST